MEVVKRWSGSVSGEVEKWRKGGVVERRSGGVEERRSGGVEWRNNEVVKS